jgi:hypothetical protein
MSLVSDRWMAYNTPQIVEIMHRETPQHQHTLNETLGNECPTEGINASICMRRYQWAYLAIHGNASLHASRVYNRTHSEEYNPTFLSTIEQHIADRGDSVGKTANQHASQTTRVPHKRIHNAAHEHIRKHQPLRHLQLHPFTSDRETFRHAVPPLPGAESRRCSVARLTRCLSLQRPRHPVLRPDAVGDSGLGEDAPSTRPRWPHRQSRDHTFLLPLVPPNDG